MDVLQFAAFLVGVAIMYWSMPIGCLIYRIRFLSFSGKRDDMFQWSKLIAELFGISFHHVGTGILHRTEQPVMYLGNHRSWADFFLDIYLTEGRAAMLSRWAVLPCFPLFLLSAMLIRGVIFFNRNRVGDKTAFNSFLDKCIKRSPAAGLIVYPEGHRSTLQTSLPLRRGMLHYAHSRQMSLQIIITKNKESVLSEKKFTAGFGAQLMVGYSEVIETSKYESFEDLMSKVQSVWDSTWQSVNAADATYPLLKLSGDCGTDFPLDMKIKQAAFGCIASFLLLVLCWGLIKVILSTRVGIPIALAVLILVIVAVQKATLPSTDSKRS